MHVERFSLSHSDADLINSTRSRGGRIIAVGTTTARVLESVARGKQDLFWGDLDIPTFHPSTPLPSVDSGRTRIFLHPPKPFLVLDGLITNFHLPQSTLLMLVSAFAAPGQTDAGRQLILETYQHAIQARYRFFSYGDAMLLL
jgi:S-adenosylmethionine:tRNA ribosyltransferase-isomerase